MLHNLFYFSKFFPASTTFIPFKQSYSFFTLVRAVPAFFTQLSLDLPFWFRIITKKTHSIFTQRTKVNLNVVLRLLFLKTVYADDAALAPSSNTIWASWILFQNLMFYCIKNMRPVCVQVLLFLAPA